MVPPLPGWQQMAPSFTSYSFTGPAQPSKFFPLKTDWKPFLPCDPIILFASSSAISRRKMLRQRISPPCVIPDPDLGTTAQINRGVGFGDRLVFHEQLEVAVVLLADGEEAAAVVDQLAV